MTDFRDISTDQGLGHNATEADVSRAANGPCRSHLEPGLTGRIASGFDASEFTAGQCTTQAWGALLRAADQIAYAVRRLSDARGGSDAAVEALQEMEADVRRRARLLESLCERVNDVHPMPGDEAAKEQEKEWEAYDAAHVPERWEGD